MGICDFQKLIEDIYFQRDDSRGLEGTFIWFTEEIGELARALREKDFEKLEEEFADVFAWLVSLASLCRVDLEEAVLKYAEGCPKCGEKPCLCSRDVLI
ncbi:MAG: MazG nucleotide pyrophosphohydrolase domain-containing protein [Actinomycetota bacterium]|nr:MazG nucleotide pyrophosphohydrolase domain-containing protein [Actinomycetota bacterium]